MSIDKKNATVTMTLADYEKLQSDITHYKDKSDDLSDRARYMQIDMVDGKFKVIFDVKRFLEDNYHWYSEEDLEFEKFDDIDFTIRMSDKDIERLPKSSE